MEALVTVDLKGRENFSTRKNLRLPVSQFDRFAKNNKIKKEEEKKRIMLKSVSQDHLLLR